MEKEILIVTGLSGAGISSSLKALEDLGYEVFDNFPLTLIDALIEEDTPKQYSMAIGIDTRARGFDCDTVLMTSKRIDAKLLFMTADEVILQKRFTETRRKHPLATDRPVSDGIRKELEMLYPLRDSADIVLDTSDLSIHDLRRTIEGHFGLDETQKLTVTLTSFGFKYGVPREADIVMDVRFLRNPHWDKDLKPFTGQEPRVANYIEQDEALKDFLTNLKTLIEPLLDRYTHEGKNYLTIAIGCTGGKHRSVYIVEKLNEWMETLSPITHINHRDMDRDS